MFVFQHEFTIENVRNYNIFISVLYIGDRGRCHFLAEFSSVCSCKVQHGRTFLLEIALTLNIKNETIFEIAIVKEFMGYLFTR